MTEGYKDVGKTSTNGNVTITIDQYSRLVTIEREFIENLSKRNIIYINSRGHIYATKKEKLIEELRDEIVSLQNVCNTLERKNDGLKFKIDRIKTIANCITYFSFNKYMKQLFSILYENENNRRTNC